MAEVKKNEKKTNPNNLENRNKNGYKKLYNNPKNHHNKNNSKKKGETNNNPNFKNGNKTSKKEQINNQNSPKKTNENIKKEPTNNKVDSKNQNKNIKKENNNKEITKTPINNIIKKEPIKENKPTFNPNKNQAKNKNIEPKNKANIPNKKEEQKPRVPIENKVNIEKEEKKDAKKDITKKNRHIEKPLFLGVKEYLIKQKIFIKRVKYLFLAKLKKIKHDKDIIVKNTQKYSKSLEKILKLSGSKMVLYFQKGIKSIGLFLNEKRNNYKIRKRRRKDSVFRKRQIIKGLKKEEILLESKPKKPLKKILRFSLEIIIILIFFNGLLSFSFGIGPYYSEDSNKILDVPKFMKIKKECCNYSATFSTPRKVEVLEKEISEMLKSYTVLNCDGKQYYYNEKQNYTITEYGVINGFLLNEVYFDYGVGNSCDISPKFKKLELLPNNFSLDDAKKDGNYVIEEDKVYNKKSYDAFMENVKNNISATLRIVTESKDGNVLITDLEYLSSGKFMVYYDGTRDKNAKDSSIMAYKYEHIAVNKNKLYAYNGEDLVIKNVPIHQTYYLLTLPKE